MSYVLAHTLTSPDGQFRLQILARDDGLWQFIQDRLWGPTDDEVRCGFHRADDRWWEPHGQPSGLYQTQEAAERAARSEIVWLTINR